MSTFSGLILVPDDFQFPSFQDNPHFHVPEYTGIWEMYKGQLDEVHQSDSNKIHALSLIHKRIKKDGYVFHTHGPLKVSEVSKDDFFRVFSHKGGIIKIKDQEKWKEEHKDQMCIEILVHE